MTKRASAGGVWAEVTARPERIVVNPGDGGGASQCAGLGNAFDARKPAEAQRTDCSYVYRRSSATQPGSAYTVTVTVAWSATWRGSDGSGGTLPGMGRSVSFPLRVAEGQALVTGG